MHIRIAQRLRRVSSGPSQGLVYWQADAWKTEAGFLASNPPDLQWEGMIGVTPGRMRLVKDGRGFIFRLSDSRWVNPRNLEDIDHSLYLQEEVTIQEQVLAKIERAMRTKWNQGRRGNRLVKRRPISVDDQADSRSVVTRPEIVALEGQRFDAND